MHQQVVMLVEHLVFEWVPALCLLRLAVAVKFTIALKTRFYSLPIYSLFPFPVFHTILLDDAQNSLHFTPLAWDCTVLFVVQQRRILIDVANYCDASYVAWIARFSAFSVVKCKQVLFSLFLHFPVFNFLFVPFLKYSSVNIFVAPRQLGNIAFS